MEELLRKAFQLGQQWVHDMNCDKELTNFNDWYASDEVQEQVKKCSVLVVVESACDDYVDGINMQCSRCDHPKYKH